MKRTFFNIVLIIYFSLLSSNLLSKESIGFTESGQKIILKPDFTWEYFKNDQVSVDEIVYSDESVTVE